MEKYLYKLIDVADGDTIAYLQGDFGSADFEKARTIADYLRDQGYEDDCDVNVIKKVLGDLGFWVEEIHDPFDDVFEL